MYKILTGTNTKNYNLKSALSQTRRKLRRLTWSRPYLYWPVALIRQHRWIYQNNFDVLVAGFPRSANSYLAAALKIFVPSIRVLSHAHVPAYAIRAINSNKKVCVTIRNPQPAIASWVVFQECSVQFALHSYIDFYASLVEHLDNCSIAPFDEIVLQTESAINKILKSTAFKLQPPNSGGAILRSRIEAEIAKLPWSNSFRRISTPHPMRHRLLESARLELLENRHSSELRQAEDLYNMYISKYAAN